MLWRIFFIFLTLTIESRANASESARDILTESAFLSTDRSAALTGIKQAIAMAQKVLVRNPKDLEARLQRAVALSYRGRLKRDRSDLQEARHEFEVVIAAAPMNAEAHMALAGWHLGGVIELGPLLGKLVLGADKARGLQELDRALALGGNRAFFPAVAALHRIQLKPPDISATRRLVELALASRTPEKADQILKHQCLALLPELYLGNGKRAARKARSLLPFGQIF